MLCCGAVWSCNGESLAVGEPLPDVGMELAKTDVVVLWALRVDDVLTCQHVASALREMQRTVTTVNVKYVVVVLGENRGVVDAFLRVQRLDAAKLFLSAREFERAFRGATTPLLLIANKLRVEAIWIGRDETESASSRREVDTEVKATLGELLEELQG